VRSTIAGAGSPTGPACTFTTARSGHPAAFLVTGAAPGNGNVALGFSVIATNPVPTPFGTLGLGAPIEIPFYLNPDATGRAELPAGSDSGASAEKARFAPGRAGG
jgi:hypothetical protein